MPDFAQSPEEIASMGLVEQMKIILEYLGSYVIPTFADAYHREARCAAWPDKGPDQWPVFDSSSNPVEGVNSKLNVFFKEKPTFGEAIVRVVELVKREQREREEAVLGEGDRDGVTLAPRFFPTFGKTRAQALSMTKAEKLVHIKKTWPQTTFAISEPVKTEALPLTALALAPAAVPEARLRRIDASAALMVTSGGVHRFPGAPIVSLREGNDGVPCNWQL